MSSGKQLLEKQAQNIVLKTKVHASEDLQARCGLLLIGLAAGDSLGATSEFQIPWEVTKECIDKYPPWPAKIVGGGKAVWNPGEPTDDTHMAMAIVRAVNETLSEDDKSSTSNVGGVGSHVHIFKPQNVLKHWLNWVDTRPKDIGTTTYSSLSVARTREWWDGGLGIYSRNPKNYANGSLMRNGAIPALFPEVEEETAALDATIMHGIVTHWNPVTVICCILHTLLIREGLWYNTNNQQNTDINNTTRGIHNISIPPTMDDLKKLLDGPWKTYWKNASNPAVQMWLRSIEGEKGIEEAQKVILDELNGFVDFDFFHQDYRGVSGSAILSLKVALWALHWSFQEGKEPSHPKIPEWLPDWIFKRHGFDCIMWVVSIGADADTYGATAGPLLAAFHPKLNKDFTDALFVKDEVLTIWPATKKYFESQ